MAEVKEACATIRKAMVQINELTNAGLTAQSINQVTRWVNTKEEHAKKIIDLMANYCLCQRVKPVGAPGSPFTTEKDYLDALKVVYFGTSNRKEASLGISINGFFFERSKLRSHN